MSAISKIHIDGFKAFPEEFTLDLDGERDGKHLLIYGENGSGKSSIYYALHCMFQSQCKDKGSVYFNPDTNSAESIVNRDTKKSDAYVELEFHGDATKYKYSKDGYAETPRQPISVVRDLNGECVFINHKFLFNVFSFRNSQYIDLFPVFIKDILSFVLTRDKSEFISQIYDDVMKGIKRHGKSNQIEEAYKKRIKRFNEETKHVIYDIINQEAGNIYNKYFRNEEERNLKITLEYADNHDNVPQPNKSYWLRCGYEFQYVTKAGRRQERPISRTMEVLKPSIILKVEELMADNSYQPVEKPQTYFSEAKLTAIALSIRFALLDTVGIANGRFLALDDMLISLDMSNRMKVIYYLLNVVAKSYKLYVFTHDRLFYHTFKRIIETQYDKFEWVFGGLYLNDLEEPIRPEFKPETTTKIKDVYEAYVLHDYFRCGTLLRSQCEQCLKELLPDSLRIKENVQTKLTEDKNLDEMISSLEDFCLHEQIDFEPLKLLKLYKDLFLNSTAHNDITSPFYRHEIKSCLKAIEYLSRINRSKTIQCKKDISFEFQTPDGKSSLVSMRTREPIRLLKYNDQQCISYYSKCEIRKIVVDGTDIVLNEGFESINQAYFYVCQNYNCPSNLILLDVLRDRNGYLKDKI